MKHYSCSWPISYYVNILVCYSQCQGNNLTIFESLILGCLGFEMCKIFRTRHIIRKLGVAGVPIFEINAIIKFIQFKAYICNFC